MIGLRDPGQKDWIHPISTSKQKVYMRVYKKGENSRIRGFLCLEEEEWHGTIRGGGV